MSPRMLSFIEVIEQERHRWMSFRRALSQEDQAVFDRMFACATQPLQAEVPLVRPWKFEAAFMTLLLAHEKLIDQVRTRLEAISTEKHLPDGNPSDGGR